LFRGFIKQTLAGTSIYLAALVKVTSAATGDAFLCFKESPTSPTNLTFRGRVYAKADGSNNLAFGLSKGAAGASGNPVYTDYTYTLNTTYLIVLKYKLIEGTVNNDSASLMINPVIGAPEPAPTLTATDIPASDVGVGSVLLRQGTAGQSPTVIVDGVRVTKNWQQLLAFSDVATLRDLKVDAVTVTGFSPDIYSYNDTVPQGQTSVSVLAYKTDWASTEVTTVASYIPGVSTVALTAEDGYTTHTYQVNHAYAYYSIDLAAAPEGTGTVSGGGVYGEGFTATVTATGLPGFQLGDWTEGGIPVSYDPAYSFTVTGPRSLVANFIPAVFQIIATAEPAEGGYITGTGSYSWGAEATLTAYENDGYDFSNWTENGTLIGTEPVLVISNITSNHDVVAHFAINYYTVSGIPSPPEGGFVFGSGSVIHGGTRTLTADHNTGYYFVNWTENGNVIGTDTALVLTNVTSDHFVVANFQLLTFTVTGTPDPPEGGVVTGSGTVNYGENITLTASQNTGYNFIDWTEDGTPIGTNPSLELTNITDNHFVVANFELMTFTVTGTPNPPEGGIVTGSGIVNYGGSITLTASQNTGYNFLNWTENGTITGTNPELELINVTADHNVVANFELMTFTVTGTPAPTEGGIVTGSGTVNYGGSITLSASQNTGYTFISWTEDGTVLGTNSVLELTNVTADHDVLANFELLTFEITVTITPDGSGTVSGEGTVNYGSDHTLTASANEGFIFDNWSENGVVLGTSPSLTLTNITADHDLLATFIESIDIFTVTGTANPIEGGTVTGSGNVPAGGSITLTAMKNPGYQLVNWTENNIVIGTDTALVFENVTANHNTLANFELLTFHVTAIADPQEGGTVTGSGSVSYGGSITLTAIRNPGYNFVEWIENGTILGTDTVLVLTNITSDHAITAHFTVMTFSVSVNADPTEGGTITGSGIFEYGSTATLTADANSDYKFDKWTENGITLGTDPELILANIQSDHNIIAYFMSTVGIGECAERSVRIYPSPATTVIHIESPQMIKTIEIFDITGKSILMQQANSFSATLPVSTLNRGACFIRVMTTNESVTRRIILTE
ncbi:MAG: InlB B-repeat-containing protein, partial [Bacteroidota bacterium]